MEIYEIHLIQCRCMLPQFRNLPQPVFHKFSVFSIINNDEIQPKIVQCSNCGILHKVIEINKSEIINGKENSHALLTIEDIKTSLPENINSILESYDLELYKWEEAKFVLDNKLWGKPITLIAEEHDGMKQGKVLKILDQNNVKIEPFWAQTILS